jgi:YebC/PmpR family DNA-binding regulatory protein
MIECLTDNRNRAASDVRVAVTRNGGTMADPGSVAYLFRRKGVVVVPRESNGTSVSEDDLMLAVLDAGAEDINDLGDAFEIVSEAGDLVSVRTAVTQAGLEYDSADATFIASVDVPLDLDGARKVVRLVDAIEDLDDVQNVYTNADIPDEIAEELDAD